MSSTVVPGSLAGVQPQALTGRLRRFVTPSLSDCFFLSLVVWLFLSSPDGWSRLLLDGDTGWHIRVGEWVLAHRMVPHTDLFSFSLEGKPWFAWEWGTDVIYALLYQAFSLKGIVLLGGALIGLYATLLFRLMLARGANALLSLGLALLAVGASSVHYLARPHLATLVLLPVSLLMLLRDDKQPGAAVWLLVPLTAVWTNLHGGFMALIACLGLQAIGSSVEAVIETGIPSGWRDLLGEAWARPRRSALLGALCAAASVVNPYGIELHRHIVTYLGSDWIRDTIQEFQSPKFRHENMLQFEALLLCSLPICWRLICRRRITETLWILFWAHQALGSVRHITIFVAIAAPILASELTMLWDDWVRPAGRKSVRRILTDLAADLGNGFAWTSIWPVVFLVALAVLPTPVKWPVDFPTLNFPVGMVARHADQIRTARVLSTDQWGDYLIYRNYPDQRVFIDGRSDFYGPKIGDQYVRVSAGHYEWKQILDKNRLNLALVPPEWALASLLKIDPGWRLVEDDGKALLFERVAHSGQVAGSVPKKDPPGPNEKLPDIRNPLRENSSK